MHVVLVFFLIVLIPCLSHAQFYQFKYEGKMRSFILHLPEDFSESEDEKYPLVLNFHGLGSFAMQQMTVSQMNCVADKEKFIVVYPEAVKRAWNTGLDLGPFLGEEDDVGFVNALLDSLIAGLPVDTQRIYASGMSLGGFFSCRLACELGHRFAAIAPVAGLMSTKIVKSCNPSRPIPVLLIHGTGDFIVQYCGNKNYLSAPATLKFWRDFNDCSSPGDTIVIDNSSKNDDSHVALVKYSDCKGESQVWHYLIYNGGHYWPHSAINFLILGNINDDINGSEAVWEFFKRFSLQN